MIPVFSEVVRGKLKCQQNDKDITPGVYHRISIPGHWLEMKTLSGAPKPPSYVVKPNVATYGFSPFLERRFTEVFGETPPPIDYEYGTAERSSVVSTGAVAEWLAEDQGLGFTARMKRSIDSRALDEELALFCDAWVVIEHSMHVAIKLPTEEQRLLVEIKYGEYSTDYAPRASVFGFDSKNPY